MPHCCAPDLDVREYPKRPCPPDMPQVPFLGGIFGSRGAGKTTTMIKLVKMYDACKAFDRVVVFSPTLEKDPKKEALKSNSFFTLHVHDKYTDTEFSKLLDELKRESKNYEMYLKALDAHEKFERGDDPQHFPHDELTALHAYDFRDPRETGHFRYGRPSTLVVFDDMVGDTDVYRMNGNNAVGRFALRHRHLCTSMLFLSQAFRNGVPRQLRNNLSLSMLFSNKSARIKQEIAEELSSFIEPDVFVAMWDKATSEPHNFFMVDYDAPDPRLRFRHNFDGLLIADGVNDQPPPPPSDKHKDRKRRSLSPDDPDYKRKKRSQSEKDVDYEKEYGHHNSWRGLVTKHDKATRPYAVPRHDVHGGPGPGQPGYGFQRRGQNGRLVYGQSEHARDRRAGSSSVPASRVLAYFHGLPYRSGVI